MTWKVVIYTIVILSSHLNTSKGSVLQRRLLPRSFDPALDSVLGIQNINKTFVIIASSYRSGSTFLGQFLDRNPVVQYIFEPFHSFGLYYMFRNGYFDAITSAKRKDLSEYKFCLQLLVIYLSSYLVV